MIQAEIVHHLPGRCRLRIEQIGDDPDFTETLKQLVQSWNLTLTVRVNRAARSLIVTYNDDAITPTMAHTYLEDCIQRAASLAAGLEPAEFEPVELEPVEFPSPSEEPAEPTDLTPLVNQWRDLGLPVLSLSLAMLAVPLELPAVLVGGAIVAAAMPWVNRATDSLITHHHPNTDLLDSLWMGLHTLQGNYAAPALKTCLVESRRTLRGMASPAEEAAIKAGFAEQHCLMNHLLQTDPVHDTQLGLTQATFMREAIVPTLLMGGAIFGATGNLSAAIAPFQLDFGSGIPISIATTLRSALVLAVQQGLYLRSGRVLEKLAQVDTLVLDADLLRSDEPSSPATRETIATLQMQGIALYLLHDDSIDSETIAIQVTQLGIATEHIRSAPSAEQQSHLIQALQAGGKQVAVIADSHRFKSALAGADVSIGQARPNWTMAEVLQTPFDGVLLDQDWRRIVDGIELAQRAFERIYQNTAIIVFPNLLVTWAGVFLGLNPIVNVVVNNGSAFVAEFINSQRPFVHLKSRAASKPDAEWISEKPDAALSPALQPAEMVWRVRITSSGSITN